MSIIKLSKGLVDNMESLQNRNGVLGKGVKNVQITPEQIIEIYNQQRGLCYWSGYPLETMYNKISWHPAAVSADRLDNDVGYNPNNVVLCQRIWNLGRACYPADEFAKFMAYLKATLRNDFEGVSTIQKFL